MASKKLKPLNFDSEVKKYEAVNEKKDVKFGKCRHRSVKYDKARLICPCGATWTGPRLQELFDLLTERK